MITTPKIVALAGAVVLSGTSWWLVQHTAEEPVHDPIPHRPDYVLDQFTATTMNLNGKPGKSLSALQMQHYPDDDSTELLQPRMAVFEDNSPPWEITSEKGWISGDREIVLLKGDVKIDRLAAEGIRPIHLTTSNLTIHPEQNYAETSEYVYVESDSNWVESTGMQTWFKKPVRIKLLANVRGRYEAN